MNTIERLIGLTMANDENKDQVIRFACCIDQRCMETLRRIEDQLHSISESIENIGSARYLSGINDNYNASKKMFSGVSRGIEAAGSIAALAAKVPGLDIAAKLMAMGFDGSIAAMDIAIERASNLSELSDDLQIDVKELQVLFGTYKKNDLSEQDFIQDALLYKKTKGVGLTKEEIAKILEGVKGKTEEDSLREMRILGLSDNSAKQLYESRDQFNERYEHAKETEMLNTREQIDKVRELREELMKLDNTLSVVSLNAAANAADGFKAVLEEITSLLTKTSPVIKSAASYANGALMSLVGRELPDIPIRDERPTQAFDRLLRSLLESFGSFAGDSAEEALNPVGSL